MSFLKDRVKADEVLIIDQRKMIEGLNQQILAMYLIYAMKSDVEKLKKEVDGQIKNSIMSNINSFQDCQQEVKNLFHSLKNDLVKLALEIEQKLARLGERGESNFSIARIDKEGVMKELNHYKKDVFVIEKKIENIYMLVERINKRGEVCHKPA